MIENYTLLRVDFTNFGTTVQVAEVAIQKLGNFDISCYILSEGANFDDFKKNSKKKPHISTQNLLTVI